MIGQRIAALRKNAHLSQAELARILGVSPSAVGMYEQGRREPSAAGLVALAHVFGVTTDYLLTGEVPERRDQQALTDTLRLALARADRQADGRPERPFTRQELSVLLAALLAEP